MNSASGMCQSLNQLINTGAGKYQLMEAVPFLMNEWFVVRAVETDFWVIYLIN